MIEIEKLKKAYGRLRTVYDISFGVEPAETVGLIGPNGTGKITVFTLLTVHIPADTDRMIF